MSTNINRNMYAYNIYTLVFAFLNLQTSADVHIGKYNTHMNTHTYMYVYNTYIYVTYKNLHRTLYKS